jgi:integrase
MLRAGDPGGSKRPVDLGPSLPAQGRQRGQAGIPAAIAGAVSGGKPVHAARDRAGELTRAARAGRSLLASEQAAQAEASCRMTVGQLIDLYIKRRVARRLKSPRGVEHRLRRALAPMLGRHADEIRRRDMRQLLDDVADRDLKGEADKRRHTIGTMFRWAMSQDFVAIDPTAGLASYGVETSSDRVLSAEEIGKLWPWLASAGVPVDCRDVLRLELALGARCGEIAGMVADEIDTAKWLWTLPPERSKNGKARVTPLVGIARGILRARLDVATQRLLFPTRNGQTVNEFAYRSNVVTSAEQAAHCWLHVSRLAAERRHDDGRAWHRA